METEENAISPDTQRVTPSEKDKSRDDDRFNLSPLTVMIKRNDLGVVEKEEFVNHLMSTGAIGTTRLLSIHLADAYKGTDIKRDLVIQLDKKDWNERYLYMILFIANALNEGRLYLHLIEVIDYVEEKKRRKNAAKFFLEMVGLCLIPVIPLAATSIIKGIMKSIGGGSGSE
jgi:hypothetical protein